ncbi:hypothetical protein IWQ62_001333 [Dispira parvispora]|uniref:Uncharacterized protein n=1 Tax=Dispira parvispora TaxID=1520584 RepID=A0A9W8AST0_9FUNG|nr:hypothetical protein IWQ62_001333 [Dispira parvispora]
MADDEFQMLRSVRTTVQGLDTYLTQMVKDLDTLTNNYEVLFTTLQSVKPTAEPLTVPGNPEIGFQVGQTYNYQGPHIRTFMKVTWLKESKDFNINRYNLLIIVKLSTI